MAIRIVQSKQNARVKELRAALLRPGRGDADSIALEGIHLVAEAVRSGLEWRPSLSLRATKNCFKSLEFRILSKSWPSPPKSSPPPSPPRALSPSPPWSGRLGLGIPARSRH
jgi:hypothetical protein